MYVFALELCPLVKRIQRKENCGALVTDIENDICIWSKYNACKKKSLTSEIYASKEKDLLDQTLLPIEINWSDRTN